MGGIVLVGKGVPVGGGIVLVGVGGSTVDVGSSLREVSPSSGTKIGPSLFISVGFTNGVGVGISSVGATI